MCSIYETEDGENQNFTEDEKIHEIDRFKCRKCNENVAAIKLRKNDFYCKQCFLIVLTHKFRATLGKSKIAKKNDKILIGHSGDAKSTALLHLVKFAMSDSVHKRLIFDIKILYIDDGVVKSQNTDKRRQIVNKINEQMQLIDFNTFVVSLSDITHENRLKIEKIDVYNETIAVNNEWDGDLMELISKLPSDTSKIDFIKKIRHQMLIKAAKQLNCSKIFIADDAYSLAVDIMSNVSLGRGAQLSYDAGFIDHRHPDVMILRPMKDFSRHEVEFYVKIHSLPTVDTGKFLKSTGQPSIQALTDNFVHDLEDKFSGTIFTIFRTGEKMSSGHSVNAKNDKKCIFCYGNVDCTSFDGGISAIDATTFSRFTSLQGAHAKFNGHDADSSNFDMTKISKKLEKPSECIKQTDSCCNGGNCAENNITNGTVVGGDGDDDVLKYAKEHLCYGCKLIFKDKFEIKTLPTFIVERCRETMCLDNMREQIADFLL